MFLGFLMAGMGLGAVAAGVWLVSGGSLLVALALYSLVAVTFILCAACAAFFLSEWKMSRPEASVEALHPAE